MSNQNSYSRECAWSLLNEYTQSPSLLKHALAVETCVRAYGEREADTQGLTSEERDVFINLYSVTGLLHDFDYEKYPSQEEHPFVGSKILTERGWPEEVRTAILGHAEYSGVPRVTHLDKTLFACDELAGFLTACSLVKPTKSIHDVEVAGVRKKMKDKAFAKGVNRNDIIKGAEELGVPLDDHIAFCIAAMQKDADALGLERVTPTSS
ncbi:HD domain-containing protein [Alloacidobacterium dinghuense]|uniref:HD domain-containing protein n=1 Tax=Alloacidobacterium dinghuense TaxID=2763107 RepID=A0A7G8BQ44_9BACT|nr:HD domain-containing protein [Alloacidobacterium dinghuense]QNI34664.1 HD domain-containing protein [Alloacidobacterium dinghuense]